MRGRAQTMLEDRDNLIEQLEAQLRTLGQQPARPAGGSSGGAAGLLGGRTAAGGLAGRAGLPAGGHSTGWGSAVSSTSVSPSQAAPGLLYGPGGSHGGGALAGSSSVGLTSPAFSGKFSAGLLSGSPRGSPHAHGGAQQMLPSRGHSRSSSMQMQHGPSPLSGSFNRRASDGAEALGTVGEAVAAAGGALAASRRSSSSSALQQAAAAAAAADPVAAVDALPLSTLRLQSEGSGVPVGGVGLGGRVQLLPLPGADTPTAADGSSAELASTAEDLEELPPEALKQRVLHAEGEVREWRVAIDELRGKVNELDDQTHHLSSLLQITERDAKYLREVLVSALKSGELHASSSMLQGLSRMLHFTPDELQKVQLHSKSNAGVVGGLAGYLPNFGGLTSPSPTTGNRLF